MAQAGFGGDSLQIANLQQMGIENWIDWQMKMPYTTYTDKFYEIKASAIADIDSLKNISGDILEIDTRDFRKYVPMAFWDKALTEHDIFRQKAAFALSQIFVASFGSLGTKQGSGWTTYYDVLYNNAFGNYRDLLYHISLNSIMGIYLNHFQNEKADLLTDPQPDENFAREVMQLFSIGLVELNNDGTAKLDANCNTIPTYNLEDVKQMAKVFTGLVTGAMLDPDEHPLVGFGHMRSVYDWSVPMVRFISIDDSGNVIDYHDTSEKYILGDTILAHQPGLQDIDDAIDILFDHPNVGPFIAYRLIQQLVKSNPTPAYVNRVATAFNNNGANVRGDLGAVFKAILLDPEARDCEWINHPNSGKLLQPMERFLNLFKAFEITSPSGKLRFDDGDSRKGENIFLHQAFLRAPTVFNFFSPFYAESEVVDTAGLVSPEFQIFNDVSCLHYLNRIRDAVKRLAAVKTGAFLDSNKQYEHGPFKNFTGSTKDNNSKLILEVNNEDRPYLLYKEEVDICEQEYQTTDYYDLIDHLDLVLCRGQLNPITREAINSHLLEAVANDPSYTCGNIMSNDLGNDGYHSIVKDAIYFIMISPSYAILK